jgi:hypothetical protein
MKLLHLGSWGGRPIFGESDLIFVEIEAIPRQSSIDH